VVLKCNDQIYLKSHNTTREMPVKQKFLNFVMPVQTVRLQAVACLADALIRH